MFISIHTDPARRNALKTLDCHEAPGHFYESGDHFAVNVSCLRPDMVLCNWRFVGYEAVRFDYSQPVFRFSLQLSGALESQVSLQNDLFRQANQVELRYLRGNRSEVLFRTDETSHWIDLILQPNFFRVALPDETGLLPPMIASILEDESRSVAGVCQNLTPDQLMAINQIHNNVFDGATRSMYLKSKCLEILSLFFAQQTFDQGEAVALGDRDIHLIKKARSKLQSSVTEPPTLSELARHVGLSESKLKRGFKALYKQSVFGFFRRYRMEYARKLLFEQKGNVSTVAAEVGYTNVSHFSAAFTQHHGVKPGTYLRQIKSNGLDRQRKGN
ncbi:MAG: AraC family transcriptional regulator [Candidatus Thiodiazotropha sp. (ex Ctena orbiculata)]|nr:AraC family transcriptional regulator [Candidatus Thiodiazotropha taylori]